ncbi:MAG: ABC transporter permease [Candidatus Aminicenantes bacterium]|nr:ABC transporter permease [Candidatus Aminicenantes bacterium]
MKKAQKKLPPRIAGWIISRLARYEKEHALANALEVDYFDMRARRGAFLSRCWYWFCAFGVLFHYIKFSLLWSLVMFKNYLKITLRNLRKQKGYSFINISGLVLGLTCFMLVSLYVRYELSCDKYHERYERIYRIINHQPEKNYMNSDYFAWTQGPLAPTLMDKYPEIESAVRMNMINNQLILYGEDSFMLDDFYFADPEIFDIFSLELVRGDPQTALDHPGSIIISEATARRIFGAKNPMGEILNYENEKDLIVTGVLKDMPQNSHFRIESLLPFKEYLEMRPMNAERWNPGWYCYTYCLLKDGVDPKALENKLVPLSEEIFKINHIESRLVLQPVERIHLHSHINGEISANGNITYVIIFSLIATLILIIACINYMNLGTARSFQRGREVGIRKVVGAQKSQLARQFLGESIMITMIAFIFSLAVVWIVLPSFNSFFERSIPFGLLASYKLMPFLLALVFFTGIFSGSYPAFMISAFKPITSLRGTLSRGTEGYKARSILVVFQFAVSIVLIITTFAVRNQLVYIQKKDVGYTKDRIIVIRLRDIKLRRHIHTIKTELLKNHQVLETSSSNYLPNSITSFNRFPRPDPTDASLLTIYTAAVDQNFIDLYGLKLAQGRNFSSGQREEVLLNETAAKALGLKKLDGQRLEHRGDRNPEIVGILKDFHFQSLHNEISPLCFYSNNSYPYYLSVKVKGNNIPETLKYIQGRLEAVSADYPFDYRFFDDIFNQAYRSEQNLGRLFLVCSGLAVFIACLGLFGLVAFTAEQRTKEIGIRKVLGASVSNIIQLLSNDFLKWVLLANLLSWPIAYFAMHQWLQSFAYRAGLSVWIFVVSALAALAIALVTVSYQSIKAATANPADCLRYE